METPLSYHVVCMMTQQAREVGGPDSPLILAQLAFGVIPNTDPRFFRPFDDGGPSGFAIGGAPNRSNELLLDGTPDSSVGNGMGFSPPVDAVEEIKVEAFQVDAALGHTGGGTVNMLTKAGTNQFHGTAYDFNQVHQRCLRHDHELGEPRAQYPARASISMVRQMESRSARTPLV